MQILNLNFLSVIFYLIVSIFIIFMFFVFLKKQIFINKNYPWIAKGKYFYVKYIFLLLSFFVIFLSIFQIKVSKNTEQSWKWIDIVFVLDVSKSMNVADISDTKFKYTRLDFSKKAISNFVVKNPQNRYSLVIFSWEAISSIPLTNDKNVFLTLLENVDYRNLLVQWSNFKDALNLANKRFDKNDKTWKVIVFISDWADGERPNFEGIYDKNIVYFVSWVWTQKWWKIIIWRDVFWDIKYQKYKWEYVISKLNTKNLEKLAKVLNWNYEILKNTWDLTKFQDNIDSLEKKSLKLSRESLISISGILGFISFFFFMLFFGIYIFEK